MGGVGPFRAAKAVDSRLVFPALLLLLNIGAAAMSFRAKDYRRGVYWLASAVCIAMVGFKG